MKEILVLNLTRFGDLIQTTPLLRRLKAQHPSARVTLAAQQRFSAILPLMSGYDRCILFDQDDVTLRLERDELLAGYEAVDRFVATLEEVQYDLVVNLTANRMSAYLVSLLHTNQTAGITSSDSGQRLISGAWGLYLYSFLLGDARRYNRINLVDIFSKMAGVEPDSRPVELHETAAGRLFATTFLDKSGIGTDRLVGLQLGASDTDRCWSSESFASLSDRLQELDGVRTILFGAPSELPLAKRAISLMKHPPINAVGATSIPELFSLLKSCSLLVSNDTGTMHFAAAGGVPVVMLTVGPAAFYCTGPYSAGNIALQSPLPCSPCRYHTECNNPVCRDLIPVESVLDGCRLLLGETAELQGRDAGVRFFRSRFGSDGYLEWEVIRNGNEPLERLSRRYSIALKRFLDDATASPLSTVPLFPELVALTEQGITLTSRIMKAAAQTPLPMELIGSLGAEESAIEAELKRLGAVKPHLAPLVDFLTLMRENISSDDLATVAEETRQLYHQGNLFARQL